MRVPLTLTLDVQPLIETTASAALEADEEGVPRLVGLSFETAALVAEWTVPVAAFLGAAERRAITQGSRLSLTAGVAASWPVFSERLADGRRAVTIEDEDGQRRDLSEIALRDLLTDEQIDAIEAAAPDTL